MRHFLAMILSTVLVLSLAACGGKADRPVEMAAQAEPSAQTETQNVTTAPAVETAAERESAPQVDTLVVYFSRVGSR